MIQEKKIKKIKEEAEQKINEEIKKVKEEMFKIEENLQTKIDKANIKLLKIELREFIIELFNNLYNLVKNTRIKKGDINFGEQASTCISIIEKDYIHKFKDDPIKLGHFKNLIIFLNNLKDNKDIGDELAHPKSISKEILINSLVKNIDASKNEVSKKEIVLLLFNKDQTLNKKLSQFIDNLDKLSFGRIPIKLDDVMNQFAD